ncbi:MAG: TolR protein [candidate division TM6 bacterium GW2011_GWF2_37_49]|nr:MAG: TolR protein [candidate division TM6 bacterium GW2011_GWF2_37_49]
MKIRKRALRKYYAPEIILTPMIDTFATLLIMFMVTAPMVQNSIKVDLPFGKSREAATSQEMIVTLSKDGKIYFNNYPIEKKSLVSSVQKAISQKENVPIFVKADKSIAYGKVIEVVDQLKEAGVHYVAMSTQQVSP